MITIERRGSSSEPYTQAYPQIRGGVCEYCGILDRNVESQHQYKLCPHFRDIARSSPGGTLACSYCPDHKNPDEVNRMSVLNIKGHPTNPDQVVVVCSSFECTSAHQNRFKISR